MADDVRWYRVILRSDPEDWHLIPGRGQIVMVDCGKGLPPQIGNLVKIVDLRRGVSEAQTWRVRGIERAGSYSKIGLLVTE
ncbi:MAG: hypothetical protein INR70_43750, partial [Parafilimonas terrae]|nr:hypothetical protein [Parafilimonas terrae]